MQIKTIATICTGGGILEQGAIAAGLTPIWGVEINERVSELYWLNYPDSDIYLQDARLIDWSKLESPDILHASPSCRNFSIAGKQVETDDDVSVAVAIGDAIAALKPSYFTLENTPGYRTSKSWHTLRWLIENLGYSVKEWVCDLWLWGVPQNRRRFIAIASLGSKAPDLIPPNRTVSWHESIADLIPSLAPCELSGSQKNNIHPKTQAAIARGETVLLKRNQIRGFTPCAYQSNPYCWTVTATLCTDHKGSNRGLFANLVTPDGCFNLTTRCLARIQTIPDSYKLIDKIGVDGLAIGDGVPPAFAQSLFSTLLNLPSLKAKDSHIDS
ncbi:MAG: hypothetical protein RLZZ69_1502 [Cyanobacteriota bacterium]